MSKMMNKASNMSGRVRSRLSRMEAGCYGRHGVIFLLFALFLVVSALILPGRALGAGTHVVDETGTTLSSSEISDLTKKMDKVSSDHNIDAVIVVTDSLNGKYPIDAADDYYDYNGYQENGILFYISMKERQYAVSTKGICIKAFTDAGLEYITDDMAENLKENEYYKALKKFADYAEDYMKAYEKGKPYDSGNLPKKPFKAVRDGIISILAGLGIGFGRVSILKAQTKTVKEARNAAGYLTNAEVTGGYEVLTRREHRHIERSTSSGGGGSTTHTSSSGATHGGSSGSF
jgi:uncharacterized protein